MTPGGFQSFVAWRYLMARPRKVSRIAVWLAVLLLAVAAKNIALCLFVKRPQPGAFFEQNVIPSQHWILIARGLLGVSGTVFALAAFGSWLLTRRVGAGLARIVAGYVVSATGMEIAARWFVTAPRGYTGVARGATVYEYVGWIALGLVAIAAVTGGWRIFLDRTKTWSPAMKLVSALSAFLALALFASTLILIQRPEVPDGYYFAWLLVGVIAGVLALIVALFGVIRYYFTFFTTVPIGGVWIGVMALVIVLSVMSGFENDLQNKILGSNAHIQVTKISPDEGESKPFVEWKKVEDEIDHVPGVIASMPFVTSEAVIAANNNYATVIIKGIDPDKVGKVTKLVKDVEDHEKAMKRLYPETKDDLVLPPVAPAGSGSGSNVTDPAPSDMPGGAPPVDFSGGDVVVDPAPGDFGSPVQTPEPIDYSKAAPEPDPSYGGDAKEIIGTGSALRQAQENTVHTLAIPMGGTTIDNSVVIDDENPHDNGRTASLPGILVGKELVKTIHMYVGEEVRVVSPLSDPSNPDANGNPMPYHRDFRVAGIFYTGMYEYDLKFVYVPLDSLQEFLDLGDAVDGIEVRLDNPNATDDVGAAIQAAIGPDYTVRDWKELNRNLFSALKLEKIAMFLVLAITILVASFSIIGNLIMVVVEKAKEIALLKTLGASDRGVMFLFVTQGFFIGLIGTVLGVVWGLGLCWVAATWGLPLNPDVYYIDQLPIHVEPSSVIAIAAAGIVISVGATIYPAFVAARLRPAQGLRHD